MARERLAAGQQVPLLRVEQEDEAQDDGEEGVVNVVGTLSQRRAQQFSLRCVVGRLDAAQQFVERVQYLLGQPLADLVLEAPAVREQRGETLVARETQEPGLAQQQPQRSHDRPARRGDHVGHVHVEPAGALAAGRRDEAERAAVAQQTGRYTRLPQQPFHPAVGRHLQAAGTAGNAVEVLAGLDDLDDELPRGRVSPGVALAYRKVGTQHLPAFLQWRLQLRRDRVLGSSGVALRREVPAEHRRGERPEIRQPRLRLAVGMEAPFGDRGPQQSLPFRITRENRPGADQGRCRHHEAGRPDEADPLQVSVSVWVALGHRLRRHEQGNDPPSRLPIDTEIGIERHDRRAIGALEQSNQTGIGKRHWHATVATNQSPDGQRIGLACDRVLDAQHTPANQRHRQALIGSGPLQQKRRLREHGFASEQRCSQRSKLRARPLVMRFVRIEQRNDGPGVNDDRRRRHGGSPGRQPRRADAYSSPGRNVRCERRRSGHRRDPRNSVAAHRPSRSARSR